ncbi:endothelin-converting enzyme homolog [Anoplophora glabripennis]|uniref:endothelin-converting enzyme homolog n=1 Tax=Anoplophora glabripennis TaxID=217634 RepID=UPI000874DE6A|nr:endothelin-converting enzyme homolog [Anoplophora glabripennis]
MDNYGYQPEENNGRPFAITRYPSRTGHNDYLVEVNSRSKIFKKSAFYKRLSILLLLVAIIFLIALIVISVLYTKPKPKICTTDECLRAATNIKYSLDFTADPCSNFYRYTCGKWPEEHPNHGWWSSFSSFTTISEKVAIASLNALTSEPSKNEPEAIQKSRDFFKSCMDIDALDQLGIGVMNKYLKRARLPVIPSLFTVTDTEKETFTFNWMKTETLIKQIFMMDVFIGFAVDANIYNGSENVIFVGQLYQKCPLPSPAKRNKMIHSKIDDNDNEDTLRQLNSKILKYIIKEIIVNNTSAQPDETILQEAVDVILNISDYIEELNMNYTDSDATEEDTYSISFSYLQKETDNFLGKPNPDFWANYFKDLFAGTNVTIQPETDVLYTSELEIQYLLRIVKYVLATPEIYIELYMWWVTVYAMIINTTSDVVEYINKHLAYYSNGVTNIARSRSLECALLVNNYMGYAVSYVLADESFPTNTKPKVEKMISEIKNAFVQHVESINWMDSQTKKVTLEKSKEMITFIGYPDWLFEEGRVDDYYKDVTVKSDTYLDNMMSAILSHNLRKFSSLRVKHERDWYAEPIEVNAFNSFSDNAINVPMAILNFPVYNLGLEVLNYGSIGAILGHELTHGFDNMGRKHDKYGNHVQWWTNKTIETFENLTECFIKQYDNFTIEGVEGHVKGKNTLGENLADNGGLNQAFTAYKKYINEFGEEPKLPGFENFTSSQMFFIAYGSIWCESTTVQDLQDQLEYDEHSPNSVRVIGTLQNSEDFAKSFNCPKGSPMNPYKKCKIW